MTPAWHRSEPARLDDAVIAFVTDYVRYRLGQVREIADLWADSGHMLAPLAADLHPVRAIGLCGSPMVQRSLGALRSVPDTVHYTVAESAGPQFSLPLNVDVVVGMPPWHWAPQRVDLTDPTGAAVALTEDPANIAMVRACRCLTRAGLGIFVVGPGVLMRPGPGTIMPNLERLGLHIDGIIELPRGAIKPDHGAAQLLLVISQVRRDPLIGSIKLQDNTFAEFMGTQLLATRPFSSLNRAARSPR